MKRIMKGSPPNNYECVESGYYFELHIVGTKEAKASLVYSYQIWDAFNRRNIFCNRCQKNKKILSTEATEQTFAHLVLDASFFARSLDGHNPRVMKHYSAAVLKLNPE